jgi:hypothetical protein
MRKIISLGLFALILSIFSSQVFAGKVPFCEVEKDELKSKGLYGLCNAYWNVDDENDKFQILVNFVKKAGTTLDDPGMPGWKPDGLVEVTCPCWDFDTLVQVIACSNLPLDMQNVDPDSDDETGFDMAWFQDTSNLITAFAGYTPVFTDANHECFINVPAGEGKVPYKDTNADEDAVCRLDVLDLIAEPPLSIECNL